MSALSCYIEEEESEEKKREEITPPSSTHSAVGFLTTPKHMKK
jgi:hypothetical protein